VRCDARVTDAFEKKCCHVDCYTLADCKLMVSHECTSVPVECAMGQLFLRVLCFNDNSSSSSNNNNLYYQEY